MKLIIDIDEEEYNKIEPFLNGETISGGFNLFKALEIIKNGTPLPKGHGRLIDADALLDKQWEEEHTHEYIVYADDIDDADIIIEADKEGERECVNLKE